MADHDQLQPQLTAAETAVLDAEQRQGADRARGDGAAADRDGAAITSGEAQVRAIRDSALQAHEYNLSNLTAYTESGLSHAYEAGRTTELGNIHTNRQNTLYGAENTLLGALEQRGKDEVLAAAGVTGAQADLDKQWAIIHREVDHIGDIKGIFGDSTLQDVPRFEQRNDEGNPNGALAQGRAEGQHSLSTAYAALQGGGGAAPPLPVGGSAATVITKLTPPLPPATPVVAKHHHGTRGQGGHGAVDRRSLVKQHARATGVSTYDAAHSTIHTRFDAGQSTLAAHSIPDDQLKNILTAVQGATPGHPVNIYVQGEASADGRNPDPAQRLAANQHLAEQRRDAGAKYITDFLAAQQPPVDPHLYNIVPSATVSTESGPAHRGVHIGLTAPADPTVTATSTIDPTNKTAFDKFIKGLPTAANTKVSTVNIVLPQGSMTADQYTQAKGAYAAEATAQGFTGTVNFVSAPQSPQKGTGIYNTLNYSSMSVALNAPDNPFKGPGGMST